MTTNSILGIDIGKNTFQLHGTDKSGKAVHRKRLPRCELAAHVATLQIQITDTHCIRSSNRPTPFAERSYPDTLPTARQILRRAWGSYGVSRRNNAGHLIKPSAAPHHNHEGDCEPMARIGGGCGYSLGDYVLAPVKFTVASEASTI